MTEPRNEIAEMILRHAGSNRPDSPHEGNKQFVGRARSGLGGLNRSCGRCGEHKPPKGGKPSVRYGGWVCAVCAAALGLGRAK